MSTQRFDAKAAATSIECELAAVGVPERAVNEKAYLESELDLLGASVPATRAVVKAFRRDHSGLGHDGVIALVEALWAVPVHERRMAAVEVLCMYDGVLGASDMSLIERLLRECRTWALLDGLAINVVGGLVERHPELTGTLDRWAVDPDFWLRRATLLALLRPLRRGEGDFERFGAYADRMLEDTEFFVRKAIGWVLREVSKKRPEVVVDWLGPRAHRASALLRLLDHRVAVDLPGEFLRLPIVDDARGDTSRRTVVITRRVAEGPRPRWSAPRGVRPPSGSRRPWC